MDRTKKAILLSILVFPGAGHFFLKKYVSAILLMSIAFSSFYYLTVKMFERSQAITEQIQRGEINTNLMEITQRVTTPLTESDIQSHNIALTILAVSWIVAIIDSYRIARHSSSK